MMEDIEEEKHAVTTVKEHFSIFTENINMFNRKGTALFSPEVISEMHN